jgi:anti-repressor protein
LPAIPVERLNAGVVGFFYGQMRNNMNELIKITTNNKGLPAVSGRELHEFLEVETEYRHWFARMCEYGFVECVDFNPVIFDRVQLEGEREVTRTITDHAISLDMAKEIAMIQRTERGKQARQYFIECERRLNQLQLNQSPEQQFAAAVLLAQKIMSEKDAIISEQKTTIEHQVQKITADVPKVVFADAVAASQTSITVFELAKIIRQNGYEIGGQRLFEILRERGYICKQRGSQWNMPTQRSVESGWITIKETAITHTDGHITVNKTPKITGKGQTYFVNLFLKSLS